MFRQLGLATIAVIYVIFAVRVWVFDFRVSTILISHHFHSTSIRHHSSIRPSKIVVSSATWPGSSRHCIPNHRSGLDA